ncbi:hypothetical protein [Streptomyces sp. ME18-1-4]|uniref:hypothetical protein n=1 Tax=Streptomyces sp. ME18-1-4 TaxID=3028685 RepID=UPI0029A8E75F|nr:hypothetical protein [Streptomyces sp. ME18-1-4]MDX3245831.1 hypothetical protein [Streptomyces sp. ME18-1-4]
MALIRKTQAGSDSFGHVWSEDGAVVEIDDPEQIASLMAIADGGFSEVTPSDGEDPGEQQEPEGKKEISEIDPTAPAAEPEAKAPAKKTAARKTAASAQTVEE